MTKEKFTPKVAVITRTKDRPLLLERAIQSVHNQTMRDFIHVIINDGGDQRVVDELIQKYEDLIDGRVKIIHNKTSHGMEAASNKAIKSIDSIFVAIHDDDDSWHPDFLRYTTKHMNSTGSMGLVVPADRIDEEIRDGKIIRTSQKRYMPDMRFISLYRQCLDNQMTPITFIYRRVAYDAVGMYDVNLHVCGDWDFGIRFLREYDVDFLDDFGVLAYYHHRPSATGHDSNSVFDKHKLFEQTLNKLRNKYLREDLRDGVNGIGVFMNTMERQRTLHVETINAISGGVVRVERHINYNYDQYRKELKRQIQEESRKSFNLILRSTLKRVKRRISKEMKRL